MCVWPCVQTTRFKALWQGFKKRVLRHIQDLRAFCVCVSGSACRPYVSRHCSRVSKNVYRDTYRIWGIFTYVCVKAGQGSTRLIQPSGMLSVMHTAAHSHKMRKICSDAQLINDGGSVNMYIVPYFVVPNQISAIPRSISTRSRALARRFLSLKIRAPHMNDTMTELRRTSDTTEIIESGLLRDV